MYAVVGVAAVLVIVGSESVSEVLLPLIPIGGLAAVWVATRKPGDAWNEIDLQRAERLGVLGAWIAGTIAALLIAPNIVEALMLGVIPAMAVLAFARLRRTSGDRQT
jgi:hypothetical protein